jgi:predicted ATPase
MARITRVRLENYKSIKFCDVRLEPLTVLVGQNGGGKSNFLDALSFLSESLRDSLDVAFRNRDGFLNIIHKSSDYTRADYFRIYVEFEIGKIRGFYDVKIGKDPNFNNPSTWAEVFSEELKIYNRKDFSVTDKGVVFHGMKALPIQRDPTRLFLVRLSGEKDFSSVFSFLSELYFYNPNPEAIRYPQKVSSLPILSKDGNNLALSVQNQISKIDTNSDERGTILDKIRFYLNKINPNFEDFNTGFIKPEDRNHIAFFMGESRIRLYTPEMSDGTLRAFAIIVSLFQQNKSGAIAFVGLEEPETGLHPAVLSVFFEAIREANEKTQILITTHSPDLLDHVCFEKNELVLAVEMKDGQTIIAPIDSASREIVRRKLYTLGDLLRMNQLEPEFMDTKELA